MPGVSFQRASPDRRVAPRKRCFLPVTELVGVGSISADARNLSATGLFLASDAIGPVGAEVRGRLALPFGADWVGFSGEIIRRTDHTCGEGPGVGIRFREVESSNPAVWTSYLLDQQFAGAIKQVQRRATEDGGATDANLKPLRDTDRVTAIFASAARAGAEVEILWRGQDLFEKASLTARIGAELVLSLPTPTARATWNRHDLIYGRVLSASQWFYFESYVVSTRGHELQIIAPEMVLFAERRVELRRVPTAATAGVLELGENDTHLAPAQHRLLEATDSGASFMVGSGEHVPRPGDVFDALSLRNAKGGVSSRQCRVVHATAFAAGDVRVGVQFQFDRSLRHVEVVDFRRQRDLIPFVGPIIRRASRLIARVGRRLQSREPSVLDARLVRYRTARGHDIAAFVNSTMTWPPQGATRRAPVVIIPPAFARRKETTGLLALTLVNTFRQQGRDLVVIRFDGVNSVGESTNTADTSEYGEMAGYTLSQLVDDIRETIVHVTSQPLFDPETITLVTFSMASIAARRLLSESESLKIRQWISCMGASDSDDLMRNSTGGLDYLEEFEQGHHLGVKEVLGQLIDLDRFCSDVILHRMAYLEDARRDLAKIATPVTWIYGQYDYWINRHRVLDIMSLRTDAPRRIYQVPCGHIVRSGEDALDVFGLITSLIWTDHYGTNVRARLPSGRERQQCERAEWGRIEPPRLDLKRYWRSYLMGSKAGEIGFDILTITDEYLGLMDRQIDLLDIGTGERVVDIGCGTGNFGLRYLARSAGQAAASPAGPRILSVDFVRRALEAGRTKHQSSPNSSLAGAMYYLETDLNLGKDGVGIPIRTASVSKVLASLFLSYVDRPARIVSECARILRPGGLVVVSTLLPDTDMSLPIHRLVEKIKAGGALPYFTQFDRDALLNALQLYINSAAQLTDLEERKLFRFFSESELKMLVADAGFSIVGVHPTFGDPPQGIIVVGRRC